MYKEQLCWLPFLSEPSESIQDTLTLARHELDEGMKALNRHEKIAIALLPDSGEGFSIERSAEGFRILAGEKGVPYGAYRLLMRAAADMNPETPWTSPQFALRMLHHWDNMDGTVERGYAGRSLFFEGNTFQYDPIRIRQYARLLASVGINAVCINNVNVHAPADKLILPELLPEVARLADIFRPYGIRLLLAVDYALPVTQGLDTADPLDPAVERFWRETVERAYVMIPDLAGLVIKADSEHRPGPYAYGRTHAEGARPLARALAPHGGVLVWRCFVYNCKQDWRDQTVDRPMAAYENYDSLDGLFDENVILEVKNGPFDFQVREPNSPLFYALLQTVKMLEVQLTQEYTGHQVDLYYMPPQWAEILQMLGDSSPRHICAVSNVGRDANWTGHDLAQANLFAYGRMAWDGAAAPEETARWWARLTLSLPAREEAMLVWMLLASRGIYEQYTAPLGLCWMVVPGLHYGPSPEGYEYSKWGTYLRTTRDMLGTDRTPSGSGYTAQYPAPLASLYENTETCPEELLLFFHRVPYGFKMRDGRTVIQRIYDDHFEGAEGAEALLQAWESLSDALPPPLFVCARERFVRQVQNACEWRDVINTYFFRYSGVPDEKGRKIYP